MNFSKIDFLLSVHDLGQLPGSVLPEFAFAGRSNVGKSSLMNTLIQRKGMVKISGKPGKTQGLNFFQVAEDFMLVDLPGYGFAKVSKKMQDHWQDLISGYILKRLQLRCVVVIVDIRHEPKQLDRQLLDWLKDNNIRTIAVYTKTDKLSVNQCQKNASILDAGHGIKKSDRVLFSAKTGKGRDELIEALSKFL
ncbi:MAG: ribosome biogenesis GTP-binding protein YihA/YsxC [Desulfotalea sp.]